MMGKVEQVEVREQGLVAPVLLPPDEHRIATRGDIKDAEAGLRREMRLLLVVGVATGNVIAALVAGYFSKSASVPVESALQFLGL